MAFQKAAHFAGHKGAVYTLAKGEAPGTFLSGSGDGWVVAWVREQPDTAKVLARTDANIFALCHLGERAQLVLGDMHGGVHWVDYAAQQALRSVAQHRKGVFDIQALHGHVLTLGGDGALCRWDTERRQPLATWRLSGQSLRCMDFCPQRQELAIGASDHSIYFLDALTGQLRRRIEGAHGNSVFALRYAPDGQHLLSGGRDALLKHWDLGPAEPRCLSAQPAHWYTINSIALSPSGEWFATGSRDKTVKIWETRTARLLQVLDAARDGGHINSVNRVLWLDELSLLSASDDRSIVLWAL